ncbi:hypothetical protein [Roseateles sp. P5_E7]
MRQQTSSTAAARQRLFLGMGLIGLHRAFVSLPDALTSRDRPLRDRKVFFEAPLNADRHAYLEQLLASAWCTDTTDWADRGYIYNCESAYDMASASFAAGDDVGDLCLFETGAGGDMGVGPERIHYARAADVDLFVPPLTADRLRSTLEIIERMYAAEAFRAEVCRA